MMKPEYKLTSSSSQVELKLASEVLALNYTPIALLQIKVIMGIALLYGIDPLSIRI